MTTTTQGIKNTLENSEKSFNLAKEILRKRDEPTEAELDAYNRDRDESPESKTFRAFSDLGHLQFIAATKAIEEDFIEGLEEITRAAIEAINYE